MQNYTPKDWEKITLEFISRTTSNLASLTLERALQFVFEEAQRISNANACFFLNINGLVIEKFSPKEYSKENESFHNIFKNYLDNLNSGIEQQIGLEHLNVRGESGGTSCIMKIPIQDFEIKAIFFLSFDSVKESIGDYIVFASLLQAKIKEIISFNTLKIHADLSREVLDLLVFSSSDSVVFIEECGNLALVNDNGANMLSVSSGSNDKKIVIKAIENLVKKTKNGKHESFIKLIEQIGITHTVVFNWQFLNPKSLPVKVTASPVRLENTNGMLWTFKESDILLGANQTKTQLTELTNVVEVILNSSLSGIMAFKTIRNNRGEILDFICIMSNLPADRIFKLNGKNASGRFLKQILPANIQEELFFHFSKVVETNVPYNAEIQYKSGSKFKWYHTIVIRLNDGFTVTFSDITKRKLSEEKLVLQRAKLKGLLENTNDLIFSVNDKGKITNLNSSFYKTVFNKTGKKLKVGDRISTSLFSGLHLPLWKKYFKKAFAGKHVVKEISLPENGKTAFYDFSFNPIRTKASKVKEVSVFGHEVTKQKTTQNEIRNKSQLLNGILNNLPIVIFRVDSNNCLSEFEGSGLNKIIGDKNYVIGKSAFNLFPELANINIANKSDFKTRFFSKGESNGEPWVFEIFVFQDETNLNGIIGFGIDVTEQQQLEESLFKAKEIAERASLAKSYFLANQSHEIRTPINTILGFAQLIKNNRNTEESEEYLDYIISSGQTLLGIIGNILDLTKIEDGKLELVNETFDFKKLVSKDLIPYEFQAKEKGLSLELIFDENFPKYLIGDIEKINQIIINLVSNSIKFTKEGSIKVSFYCLSINTNTEVAKIRVMVSDTGIGIPLEAQQEIFSQFSQGNNSISKKFGGSGLGLAIVKELVKAMDGEVGVLSPGELKVNEEQRGSTFWFTLSLKMGQSHSERKGRPIDLKSLGFDYSVNVLLVDDNPVNQRLGMKLLENLGCNVSSAWNAEEAIELLGIKTFDLVLMDVHMPDMDGCETTAFIRNKLNLNVPIIGLSANVQKDIIDYCLKVGMNDFLGRPYALNDFYDKVMRWARPKSKGPIANNVSSQDERLTGIEFLNQVYNGDRKMIADIIDKFIAYQENMLERISREIFKSNLQQVSELAHELRSSIQLVGLETLESLLIELESKANDSTNKVVLYNLFLQIKDLCIEASDALKNSIISDS